jgi:hypothetical protein
MEVDVSKRTQRAVINFFINPPNVCVIDTPTINEF